MKSTGILALLLIGLLHLTVQESSAQEPAPEAAGTADVQKVELFDGTVLFGTIISESDTDLVLLSIGGVRFELLRSDIRSVSRARGSVVGREFWGEDPSGTRLFFTSTGRALPRGEGYAGVYLLTLPFAAVGVTDRFTMGGGAPVLFGEFTPFYLAPKLQVLRQPSLDVSVGSLMFFFGEDTQVGIAYGVATGGSRDVSVTGGLGFGFVGADFSRRPVGMLGLERRLTRRFKFVSENYALPVDDGALLLSGGIRILGEDFSGDIGLGAVASSDVGFCCLPVINLSYSFGRDP